MARKWNNPPMLALLISRHLRLSPVFVISNMSVIWDSLAITRRLSRKVTFSISVNNQRRIRRGFPRKAETKTWMTADMCTFRTLGTQRRKFGMISTHRFYFQGCLKHGSLHTATIRQKNIYILLMHFANSLCFRIFWDGKHDLETVWKWKFCPFLMKSVSFWCVLFSFMQKFLFNPFSVSTSLPNFWHTQVLGREISFFFFSHSQRPYSHKIARSIY